MLKEEGNARGNSEWLWLHSTCAFRSKLMGAVQCCLFAAPAASAGGRSFVAAVVPMSGCCGARVDEGGVGEEHLGLVVAD